MSNPIIDDCYRQITKWFHTSEYGDLAPIDSVEILCTNFFHYIRCNKLTLVTSEKQILKSLCEATCTLRDATLLGSTRTLIRKALVTRPKEWTDELEEDWILLMESLCSTDVIDSLFESIPRAAWEHDVHHWREVIGTFLVEYIQPTWDVLERHGYITKVNDVWIRAEDQEEEWNEY